MTELGLSNKKCFLLNDFAHKPHYTKAIVHVLEPNSFSFASTTWSASSGYYNDSNTSFLLQTKLYTKIITCGMKTKPSDSLIVSLSKQNSASRITGAVNKT